jgi:hypothetical protein
LLDILAIHLIFKCVDANYIRTNCKQDTWGVYEKSGVDI